MRAPARVAVIELDEVLGPALHPATAPFSGSAREGAHAVWTGSLAHSGTGGSLRSGELEDAHMAPTCIASDVFCDSFSASHPSHHWRDERVWTTSPHSAHR